MKLLIVASLSPSLRNFRGPLITALRRSGHEVHAVAPDLLSDVETRQWLESQGAVCHELSLDRTGLNPVSDLRTFLSLRGLMRRIQPDLFLGYTAKPVIWGLVAARWAGVRRRVGLITGLGYGFTEGGTGLRRFLRLVLRSLYRFALRNATLVFFQNEDDKAEFQRLGILQEGTPAKVVAGSGIDLEWFSEQPMPQSPMTFTLIARLLGDKGIREYAAAARMVRQSWPDARFNLVGRTDPNPAGIPESEVQAWQHAGDLIWHGQLGDVRPILAQTHVYVLPSYREGAPRTVLEAMATGRAVITTDAPGCRQTLEDGVTGYLVPVRDVPALVEAMVRFLEDSEMASRMGAAARSRAEAIYDVRRVNAEMLHAMQLD